MLSNEGTSIAALLLDCRWSVCSGPTLGWPVL